MKSLRLGSAKVVLALADFDPMDASDDLRTPVVAVRSFPSSLLWPGVGITDAFSSKAGRHVTNCVDGLIVAYLVPNRYRQERREERREARRDSEPRAPV